MKWIYPVIVVSFLCNTFTFISGMHFYCGCRTDQGRLWLDRAFIECGPQANKRRFCFSFFSIDRFISKSELWWRSLELMDYLTSALLDKLLSIRECFYRIWFVVFSFRARRYTFHHQTYTLQNNFVTLNAYLSRRSKRKRAHGRRLAQQRRYNP